VRQRPILKAILVGIVFGLLVLAQQSPMRSSYASSHDERAEWLDNLHRWLSVSYSESDEFAGFGDLGSEQISAPNLYAIYGSVHILHYIGAGIDRVQPIGDWINSLLNEQGAYDDPSEDAPLVFETLWAVTALNLLGIPPEQPGKTAQFLLQLQGKDGLFHHDRIIENNLRNNVGCTALAVTILRLLGVGSFDQVNSALGRATERVASLVDDGLGSLTGERQNSGKDDAYELWAALALYASLDPHGFPEDGKVALTCYLAEIHAVPTGFLEASRINELLDAAEAVGIIDADEIPSLPGLQECLVQRITLEISGLGGYGWRSGWAGRLDPVMTWPTVRLFTRAQLLYPYRALLLETVGRYRIEKGWSSFTIAVPEADFTYFGLVIARSAGWKAYNNRKILAFAYSILEDPRASVHDLFWAAKLAERLGESTAKLSYMLRPKIVEACAGDCQDEYWVIPLLAEFSLPVPPSLDKLLRERAEALAMAISTAPRMQSVRYLIFVQRILDNQWMSEQDIKTVIMSLQVVQTGGFEVYPDSSGADLLSTHSAIEALMTLGSLGDLGVGKCMSFIISCQEAYGYAWAVAGSSPTASPADFYSTYVGISNLQLLRSIVGKRISR